MFHVKHRCDILEFVKMFHVKQFINERKNTMGRIIAIANQKGGVGKTTFIGYLAHYYADQGKKVLILSADDQNSIFKIFGADDKIIHAAVFQCFADIWISTIILRCIYKINSIVFTMSYNLFNIFVRPFNIPFRTKSDFTHL